MNVFLLSENLQKMKCISRQRFGQLKAHPFDDDVVIVQYNNKHVYVCVCTCEAVLYAKHGSVWFGHVYFMICLFFLSFFFYFQAIVFVLVIGKNSQTHATSAIQSYYRMYAERLKIFCCYFMIQSMYILCFIMRGKHTLPLSVCLRVVVFFSVSVSLCIGTGN